METLFQVLNNPNIVRPGSVNLIMTSPPFGLVRQKEYGNVDADEYLNGSVLLQKLFTMYSLTMVH